MKGIFKLNITSTDFGVLRASLFMTYDQNKELGFANSKV